MICFALAGGIIGLCIKLPDLFVLITPEIAATNALIFLGPIVAIWHGGHEHLRKKEIKTFGKVDFEPPSLGAFSKILMWIPIALLILFKGLPTVFELVTCILALSE